MKEKKITVEDCKSLLNKRGSYDTYEIYKIVSLMEKYRSEEYFQDKSPEQVFEDARDYTIVYFGNKYYEEKSQEAAKALLEDPMADVSKAISLVDLISLLFVYKKFEKCNNGSYILNLDKKDYAAPKILATAIKLRNLNLMRFLLYVFVRSEKYDIDYKSKICIAVLFEYPEVFETEDFFDKELIDNIYSYMKDIDFCRVIMRIAYKNAGINEEWSDTEDERFKN